MSPFGGQGIKQVGGFGGNGGGFGQQSMNQPNQPQQYNPFPYQQPPQQQQQFNPYQQQFNPYQQFGYGQRQQMENPYQRQQQQFMNRGQDRGGFDDRATGFDGASITDYGRGGLPPDPPEGVMGTMGGYGGFLGSAGSGQSQEEFNRTVRNAGPTQQSTNDILKSLVGLGADPNNTAQRTMQDAINAQRNQQTSSNTMLDGTRPPQPPMQPPFNPYQQFNYGGGSDPRGRGGYKNDRRFGGRLPGAVDPGFSYPPPRPDLPNKTIPETNPDGSELARWDV